MASSKEVKFSCGMIWTPAAFSSSCPNARSSSRRSVYGEPPTTSLPAARTSSAIAPMPSTSSNTTTSAQATSCFQSRLLGTKPSAISCSSGSLIQKRTSCPSFTTSQAMSAIRPS